MELAKKYASGFWKKVWDVIKDTTVRIVTHIGMNLIFPGVGSALVEAYFALKNLADALKEITAINTLV